MTNKENNFFILTQIILENVELGSIIYSDCWRGYVNLNNLGYEHFTVNHSEYFVNPINYCSTQTIEGLWSVFKRKFRSRYINQNNDLSLYFAEFAFKRKYKDQAFEKILENLKDSLNKIQF
ncbi:hypothetical protein H312_00929 [Anncaliia algerae PRA339]|uniref:ISXO2-like transposase domain-containing protein n=1 Tax=Anncaliia algerae PRA339 TaxID=1288291 RepID=A0A059F352_9MICR|nr:hypothetical protein H312_00929 [Anncaliia algerae PRA339]